MDLEYSKIVGFARPCGSVSPHTVTRLDPLGRTVRADHQDSGQASDSIDPVSLMS